MASEVRRLFGIDDPWVWSAYVLSIGFAMICAVYGILNWNKEGDLNG